MNILFLDFDGVLNNENSRTIFNGKFDPENVKAIETLRKSLVAKVIIHSNWSNVGNLTTEQWSMLLGSHGIGDMGCKDTVIDLCNSVFLRHQRIEMMLNKWKPEDYFIVDDEDLSKYFIPRHFYQTDLRTGFTMNDLGKIQS